MHTYSIYTEQRSGIVAHRPARAQALYRFIGSGGGRGDEWFITDRVSFPPELYATQGGMALPAAASGLWGGGGAVMPEKLALLPDLYLVCSHATSFPRPPDTSVPSAAAAAELRRRMRAAKGLPADALLLGALNKYYKVTPEVFGVWCGLLRRVPAARLVLVRYRHYREAEAHLTEEAGRRGVAASRLVFVPEGSHKHFLEIGASVCVYARTHACMHAPMNVCLSRCLRQAPAWTSFLIRGPRSPMATQRSRTCSGRRCCAKSTYRVLS